MTGPRKALGDRAEEAAARHLKRLGFKILARNLRTELGELDIVAEFGDLLVFVEVKGGTSDEPFAPHHHLDRRKKDKLRKLGQQYLARLDRPRNARFDLITVLTRGGELQVDHFEDVIQDPTP
jgi:putative endonuclease